jgi:hypothetical protein
MLVPEKEVEGGEAGVDALPGGWLAVGWEMCGHLGARG